MMKNNLTLILIVLFVSNCDTKLKIDKYPEAKRLSVADTLHEQIIPDPYRWMEDLESKEVEDFALAQDSLLKKVINESDKYKKINENITKTMSHERYFFRNSFVLPTTRNGKIYYNQMPAGESKNGLYVRNSLNGDEIELISPELEENELELAGYSISPDGKTIAYGVSKPSTPWIELRIASIDSPYSLKEVLTGFYSGISLSWTPDNQGFYYNRYDEEEFNETKKLGSPKLQYHKLGSNQNTDKVIYERNDDKISISTSLSTDKEYLMLNMNGIQIKSSDPSVTEFKPLIGDIEDASFSFIGNEGNTFYYQTSLNAPKGKVIAIDINNPKQSNWKTIIPESDQVLSSVTYNSGKFIIMTVKDIIEVIKVYDTSGAFLYEVEKPFIGSSYSFKPMEEGSNAIFFSLINLFNPQSILHLDLNTGKTQFFLRPEQTYDPDEFTMEQVFYTSKDGTRIPALLSYKKGIKKNGNNPAMVYAYGALGAPTVTFFQADIVEWLKMGGIYLNAGIRGGGEYGNKWREAGRKINKMNGIEDYISAAKWLVDEKYTNPSKLAATGGSLSGVLPAAAITMKPDFYAAAVITVPVLDMVRFRNFGYSRSWISEFGDPDIEEEFNALIKYSPYHNVKTGVNYPAVLIQCGGNDDIAAPLHAYKFAAALQHAQASDNPILLKTSWGAGHYLGGVTTEEQNETRSQVVTFLVEIFPEMK